MTTRTPLTPLDFTRAALERELSEARATIRRLTLVLDQLQDLELAIDLPAPCLDPRCAAGDHNWVSECANAESGSEDFTCDRCGSNWTARF